jgi:hypothetical protein
MNCQGHAPATPYPRQGNLYVRCGGYVAAESQFKTVCMF